VEYDETGVRRIPLAGGSKEGKHKCQNDALLDTDEHDRERSDKSDPELGGPDGGDASHASEIDKVDADTEDNRGQGRLRQQLKRTREKQQNEQRYQACCELCKLAAAAGALDHLGFGRTAIDDECAGNRGTDIGKSQTNDVPVFVELLVFLRGESSRGRGTLSQNDDKYGSGCRQELLDQRPAPRNRRQA